MAGEGGSKTWTMTLSIDEARMAFFEKDENFRWIANMFAPVCSTRLSECVPEKIQQAVYALGEFAEIAHGSIDPEWILKKENRLLLGEPGFPLEKYPVLAGRRKDRRLVEDIKLVSVFHGEKGTLQGYCAIRMRPQTPAHAAASPGAIRPQLILTFSGTSNLRLAMYDVQTTRAAYRTDYQPVNAAWLVHSGFQTVYQGIRREAFRAVNQGLAVLKEANITDFDFVITAHSLGTAVGYLTLLDILRAPADDAPQTDIAVPRIPDSSNITIALFGAPRVGNKPFVEHFRELVQERRRRTGRKEALTEWSVIGHLDGVPALPPTSFGYEHFSPAPFYSYGGLLFSIPPKYSEFTRFNVNYPKGKDPLYSRGGHNYYGARDMERLQRRIKAIRLDLSQKQHSDSIVYSNPSKRQTDAASDVTRATTSTQPKSTRRWSSLSSMKGSKLAHSHAPILDGGISEDPENLTIERSVEAAPSAPVEPEWMKRYLDREKAEDAIWKKKNSGGGLLSRLSGLLA